jgi:multiple sugar transport system substrate-binding protein
LKDLRNLMAIGRLGMYFDQAWGVGGVFGINPAIKSQLAVAPIPATGATGGVSNLNAHVLCIMKASKHKKEAAKFVEFITSKATMIDLAKQTPFYAPRRSIDDATDFEDAFLKGAKRGMNQIVPLPKQNPNYENAYLELVKTAQMVTIGNESPESAVKALQSRLQTILK